MSTTRKDIQRLLNQIADLTGNYTNKEDAIKNGKDKFYQIDYNSIYGGYRIAFVNVVSGGHGGTFDESSCVGRRSARKMYDFLRGILAGIEYQQKAA